MCEFSARLIAWLDNELPESEAAVVDQHVRGCTKCRIEVEAFGRVSRAIDVYCDAAITPRTRGWTSRRVRVLAGVAAVAAVAAAVFALHLTFPRARIPGPSAIQIREAEVSQANVLDAAPAHSKRVHRRRAVTPLQNPSAGWLPPEPTVEIAIPAEAMYPPGAVPEGMSFIVDVRIAADGSAQQVHLRP